MPEKRPDETQTSFAIRLVREQAFEEAAKVADRNGGDHDLLVSAASPNTVRGNSTWQRRSLQKSGNSPTAEKTMSERAALIEAYQFMESTLEKITQHKPGPGVQGTVEQLLKSAVGHAETALAILKDRDHYPALRDLPEIPEDDED